MCVLQMEYFSQHPRGVNPVQLNDVMFSLHATAACIVTALQCFIYDVCWRFSFSLLTDCLHHQSATVSIHTEPQKSLNMKLKTSSLESPWLGPWSWENLENSWRMRCVKSWKGRTRPIFPSEFPCLHLHRLTQNDHNRNRCGNRRGEECVSRAHPCLHPKDAGPSIPVQFELFAVANILVHVKYTWFPHHLERSWKFIYLFSPQLDTMQIKTKQ